MGGPPFHPWPYRGRLEERTFHLLSGADRSCAPYSRFPALLTGPRFGHIVRASRGRRGAPRADIRGGRQTCARDTCCARAPWWSASPCCWLAGREPGRLLNKPPASLWRSTTTTSAASSRARMELKPASG